MLILFYIVTGYTGAIPISEALAYDVLYELTAECGLLWAFLFWTLATLPRR